MKLKKKDLTVVRDDRHESEGYEYEGYYSRPETYGDLVTEATGALRKMVLDKIQYAGDYDQARVTITEENWNSGYCETCSCPETDFHLQVDGTTVFSTREGNGYRLRYSVDQTTFAVLQAWLEGKADDEEDEDDD